MSLWDWAVAAYARPDVEAACLALQDRHGEDAPLLLWAAWATPGDEALGEGVRTARLWRRAVISPLRDARRALKAPPFDHEALRADIKAAELNAERALLEALEAIAPQGDGDALAALEAASRAWGRGAAAPRKALQRLAAALSGSLPAG